MSFIKERYVLEGKDPETCSIYRKGHACHLKYCRGQFDPYTIGVM